MAIRRYSLGTFGRVAGAERPSAYASRLREGEGATAPSREGGRLVWRCRFCVTSTPTQLDKACPAAGAVGLKPGSTHRSLPKVSGQRASSDVSGQRPWSAVTDQRSAVSGQRSAVSGRGQRSAGRGQGSAISRQRSWSAVVRGQRSAPTSRRSTLSAVNVHGSAVRERSGGKVGHDRESVGGCCLVAAKRSGRIARCINGREGGSLTVALGGSGPAVSRAASVVGRDLPGLPAAEAKTISSKGQAKDYTQRFEIRRRFSFTS